METEEYDKGIWDFWFTEGFLEIFADLCVNELKKEQYVKKCSYLKGVSIDRISGQKFSHIYVAWQNAASIQILFVTHRST